MKPRRKPKLIRAWAVVCRIDACIHFLVRYRQFALMDVENLDTKMKLRCSPHTVIELRRKV